jgi:hypothetical protein
MTSAYALFTAFLALASFSTAAFAQEVEEHEGSIFFVGPDGSRKQLTASGLDSQPSLSFSGRRMVFVRDTPDLKIETGLPGPGGSCCHTNNELWIADVESKQTPRRILRGHAGGFRIGPQLVLANFNSPQFSLDGSLVFFETGTWATDGAIYSLNLTTGFLRLLYVGVDFQVIRSGKYKGYIIGPKNMPHYETHTHLYWLFDPHGKILRQIGDGGPFALMTFKAENGIR